MYINKEMIGRIKLYLPYTMVYMVYLLYTKKYYAALSTILCSNSKGYPWLLIK